MTTVSNGKEGEWKESKDAGEHFDDRRLVGNDTRCEDGLFSLFCLAFIRSLPLFMEHFQVSIFPSSLSNSDHHPKFLR